MALDSVLLTGMISLACVSEAPNTKDACASAIEASSRQSGIYSSIKLFEQKLARKTEKAIKRHISLDTVADILLIAKLASKQNVSIKLGEFFNGHYVLETDTIDYKLLIGWDL